MAIRCTPNEWGALVRKRIRGDTAELHQAAREAANLAKREARRLTKAEGLIYTYQYYESFFVRQTPRMVALGNDSPAARVIERGRRPMRPGPPIEPIYKWVVEKLHVDAAEAKSAAYAIRQKIHEDGTPPHKILERASIAMRRYYSAAVVRRLQQRKAAK